MSPGIRSGVTRSGSETILIVEDDPGVAALERRCLERAGYAVLTASAARAAFDLLRDRGVSLILLDLRLPGEEDGLTFYEQVKRHRDVPVILVTGFSDEATAIRALRSGVRDFVAKTPDYLDYIPAAVARVLHQVETERLLAETQARVRDQATLLDQASDAILVEGLDHRIGYWNRGAERLYGWSAAEASGRDVRSLIYAADTDAHAVASAALLDRGEWSGELTHVTRNGDHVTVQSRWTLVRDELGQPSSRLVINTDVTETRRLHAQLLHAQRMEAVGRLAGGVAHDFNNLLTVISGYSEIVLRSLPADSPLREFIELMRQAGSQASALTSQLLAFSRRQIVAPEVFDLNQVVGNLARMLERLIGEHVEFVPVLGDGLWHICADPRQLEQVLMNLAVNACDAMPEGGRLTVATSNAVLDEGAAGAIPDATPGRYVRLVVSDTGTGIDDATMARLFEPFFTTKGPGEGTGLGLATVHGIVAQAHGHIVVTSEVGRGTSFTIYLPSADEVAAPRPAEEPAVPRARAGEAVLVIEDDEGVRALVVQMLREAGYRVEAARDGEDALRLSAVAGRHVDLVVTDVVMPRMGGRAVIDRLRAGRPALRVLYLSGYAAEDIAPLGDAAFLQKPFTLAQLAAKVRDVLDA